MKIGTATVKKDMPAPADNIVLEVGTKRLRPSQALERYTPLGHKEEKLG
jgi:hypothetical protein